LPGYQKLKRCPELVLHTLQRWLSRVTKSASLFRASGCRFATSNFDRFDLLEENRKVCFGKITIGEVVCCSLILTLIKKL